MSADCAICGEAPGRSLCRRCYAAYEREAHGVGDVIEVIAWTAARVRRIERVNARRLLRELVKVCEATITTVDFLMAQPPTRSRGAAISKTVNALNLAKDIAKRYGLAIGGRRRA